MNNQNLKTFFTHNLKLILGVLFVALLVAVSVLFLQQKKSTKEKEAANALFETRRMTDPLVQGKDYRNAISLLQSVVEKFPGTRASYETNLQMADLYVDSGMADKSIPYYEAAVKEAPDAFTKVLALYSKGIAEETNNKAEDAIKSLEIALNTKGSEFLKPEILMAQARSFELLNKADKASEIYKIIQDKYSTKPYYSSAAAAFLAKLNTKSSVSKQ